MVAFAETITEVPLYDICELNGTMPKEKRVEAYRRSRIFFMTPQTLVSDIEANLFSVEKTVCVVVDEAHRASGNYAYCNVINELEKLDVGFRLLSLSATPVSKIEDLQDVVNNLRCSMLEVRDDQDEEIKKYTYDKDITSLIIPKGNHHRELERALCLLIDTVTPFLKQVGALPQNMQGKFLTKMSVLELN